MSTLDIVLRSMAGMQLLFLALLLSAFGRHAAALRYAALLPAGLAAFMLTSAPMPRGALGAWALPLTMVCVANPAWFWISTKAWFDETFRPGLRDVLAVIGMTALGLAHELGAAGDPAMPLDALFKGAIVAFIGLALVKVMRDRPADLVESRRRARVAFVAAVWLYACVGIALQLVYDGRLPAPLVRANVVLLLIAALACSAWLALGSLVPLRGTRGRERAAVAAVSPQLPPVPPVRTARASAVDPALLARIRAAMEADRLYRQEALTVAGVAKALGSQEYLVRRAINQGLGYRNFNEFLHRYRLDEASARLRTQMHLPILSIALDVGFGSIGPFNRAFRARFGCTPTHYRNGGAEHSAQAALGEPSPHAAD